LTGAAIEIPLLAQTIWVLSRLGVGNPEAELMRVFRLTAVFAGVAALLTAGGIGRLAANVLADDASAEADLGRRRRRAIFRAARAHAVASAGLVIIAAIPHGHLPEEPAGWLAFAGAGLIAGAIAGTIIGFVCSSQAALVQLTDVWALARRPRVALRSLLDPDDLARLGSALRTRTTNLFDGIFEPAPRAPGAAAAPGAEPGPSDTGGPAAASAGATGEAAAAGEAPAATSEAAAAREPASTRSAAGDPPAGSRIDV